MRLLLSGLVLLNLLACNPALSCLKTATTPQMTRDRIMSERVEIELDIFSGNPNPIWILSEAEATLFRQQLATLSEASPRELSGNLGYRGFIVQLTNGTEQRIVRVQNGIVQISQDSTDLYYSDQNRSLERWLLDSGRASLRSDLFEMVKSQFPQ